MTTIDASLMRGDSALAIGDPGNVDSLFLDVSSLSINNYLIREKIFLILAIYHH